MKLIDYFVRRDFGIEYCFAICKFKRKSLIQFSFGWCEYPASPLIHFTMGNTGLLSFILYVYKFSFCFDLITWNWDETT